MSLITEAVKAYNGLVEKHRDQAQEFLEEIYKAEVASGIEYDGKAIATALRPNFLTTQQQQQLRYSGKIVMDSLERAVDAFMKSPKVQRMVRLSPEEDELVRIPSGLRRNVMVARLDAFMSGSKLKFVEFNTDSPASMKWMDVQQAIFMRMPILQEFGKQFDFCGEARTDVLFRQFLDEYKRYGINEEPRLLITDWNGVSTTMEFVLLKEYFEAKGVPTVIADPRELEFKDDHLWVGDFRVNMVYRRVITRELIAKRTECEALIDAAKSGKVCIMNPFTSKCVGNKAVMALLSDSRFEDIFEPEQLKVLRETVPWGCVLTHENLDFEGKQQDPFDIGANRKDDMVIKPISEYGGRGVMIGRDADSSKWEAALAKAEIETGGWCMQQFVDIPEEVFPVLTPDLAFEPRKVNLNPYTFGGVYAGCLTRISKSNIINVSAGGGIIPTFFLAGKR